MGLAPYPWLEKPAEALLRMKHNLPGGILIYGPRGTGTYELGLNFAKSVLCSHPAEDGSACGVCEECHLLEAGTHPDLRLILSDMEEYLRPAPWETRRTAVEAKKSPSRTISIDKIRSLSEFAAVSSHRGGHRVAIVYPANSMLEEQSSALLKTLEEPPEGMVLILVSDDLDAMLPTIRSRCQMVRVAPPSKDEALRFLREEKVARPEEALARFGGMPLLVFEQDPKLALSEEAENKLMAWLLQGKRSPYDAVFDLTAQELPLPALTRFLQRYFLDILYLKNGLPVRFFPSQEARMRASAGDYAQIPLTEWLGELAEFSRISSHPIHAKLSALDLLLKIRMLWAKSGRSP
jgi:DNA polymerase-3 subunit delta'